MRCGSDAISASKALKFVAITMIILISNAATIATATSLDTRAR